MNGDMSALKGRKFDVVIDNPTTLPAWVRNVAQYMKGNTDHYIFISTISVYPDNSKPWADETATLTPMPEGLDPYTVPPADARQVLRRAEVVLGGRSREAVSGQAHDHSAGVDRRPARPRRIASPTGRIASTRAAKCWRPATPNDPVQFIDSRDLAEWTIRMAENRTLGIYNATGPKPPMTMGRDAERHQSGDRLERDVHVGSGGVPHRAEDSGVAAHDGVDSAASATTAGFMRRSISKARSRKGLTFRPLAVTAKETLAWNKTRPRSELTGTRGWRGRWNLGAAREAEVLDAWKAKKAGH